MPQSVFLFYAASFMPSSLGPLPRGASVRHKDAFKGEATLYLFRYGVGEESGAFSLLSRWSSHYVPLLSVVQKETSRLIRLLIKFFFPV